MPSPTEALGRIAALPRIPLCQLPTPLVDAPRLSASLGGPRVLLKRDDLTGLGVGGNKLRKLEFLLADAKEKGCDTVLTCGAAQSNHAALTAIAATMHGFDVVLCLWPPRKPGVVGNLLVDELIGARVVFADRDKGETRESVMDRESERLRADGRAPYPIPVGGSVGLGSVGYALCVHEIIEQCREMSVAPTHFVAPCGSGGTAGGLIAGAAAFAPDASAVTVDVDGGPELAPDSLRCAADCAALLGLDAPSTDHEWLVKGFVGPGYGVPSPEALEAIRLALRTEGVLLDPVYTGKAMAGLIAMVRDGRLTRDDAVVFVHTGGSAGLFAIGEELLACRD